MFKKEIFCFFSLIFIFMNSYAYPSTEHFSQDFLQTNKSHRLMNKKSCYRVFGKHYQVMKTSKNYEEKGVASWYGPHFHTKKTSSGERFNMFKMTAAHKTLPLSTYVLVTNLTNGRHVVVKVNDRGPFISNRLIDLSYAAARKLGMVALGTVAVNVKAIG